MPYIAGWQGADAGTLERDAAEINRVAQTVEARVRDPDAHPRT